MKSSNPAHAKRLHHKTDLSVSGLDQNATVPELFRNHARIKEARPFQTERHRSVASCLQVFATCFLSMSSAQTFLSAECHVIMEPEGVDALFQVSQVSMADWKDA